MNFTVDFRRAGNSADHRTHGWSNPEDGMVWSVGAESGLRLPGSVVQEPLLLELDVNPCIVGLATTAQLLRIRVNGALLGHCRLSGLSRVRCAIPAGLLAPDAPILVTCEHPNFIRTDLFKSGSDARALAFSFFAVRLYSPHLQEEVAREAPLAPHGRVAALSPPLPASPEAAAAERQQYSFGFGGNANAWLRDGWHIDLEGNAWTAAPVSRLELPPPAGPGPCQLRIGLCPLRVHFMLATQRISVLLDGCVIGQFQIGSDTAIAVPLPPELLHGAEVVKLALVLPDALPMRQFAPSPAPHVLGFVLDWLVVEPVPAHLAAALPARSDEWAGPQPLAVSEDFLDQPLEELPAAIEARLGVSLVDMLRDFESLGDNCGFGLAQRKGGVEVLGLLRFANTPLKSLLRGFEDQFKATTQQAEIKLYLEEAGGREYLLRIDRYGIRWHTMVNQEDGDHDTVFKQQTIKLGYLRRKFYEGTRAGRKIYAVARSDPPKRDVVMPFYNSAPLYEEKPEPLKLAEALPILTELNRSGRNTLLYLVPCQNGRRSGTVELLAPGLMRGHLETFVILGDPALQDHADWLRIVANAWLLEYGANAAFRSQPPATARAS
jgi:hypothetical protein